MSLLICGKTPLIPWVSSYSAANYFNCKANAVIAFVIQFLVPININFLANYLISTPFHSPPHGWEKSLARYCGACVNTVHVVSVCSVSSIQMLWRMTWWLSYWVLSINKPSGHMQCPQKVFGHFSSHTDLFIPLVSHHWTLILILTPLMLTLINLYLFKNLHFHIATWLLQLLYLFVSRFG